MVRKRGVVAALLCATAALLPGGCKTAAPSGDAVAVSAPAAKRPPNVIVILVDDLGWPDVSAYGRNGVPTPNIDRIAQTGAAFSNGYVTASVCAVSRAGLLTGRMPQRFGFTYNINDQGRDDADQNAGLPTDQPTIAERLKARGYSTAAFGKWHQGAKPEFYPTNRGFDRFFGFLSGETIYVDPKTPGIVTTPTKADKYPLDHREPGAQIVEGPERRLVDNFGRYLTDEITDHATDYIRSQRRSDKPFFAYVAYNAPHWPLQVPQEWYEKFASIKDPVRRTYVAMIAAMDAGVGRILDTLDQTGERDNTMIFFLSDNGCPAQFGFCDCSHPLGAGKFTYLEGGTRVPFLMSWPAGLKTRATVTAPVSSLDIAATVMAAADPGAPLPAEFDGRDLVATVDHPDSERMLVWAQSPVSAARQGNWKLWSSDDRRETKLYDLASDPAETNDVSATNPQVVARMSAQLTNFRAGLPKPLWPMHLTRQVAICNRETEWVY